MAFSCQDPSQAWVVLSPGSRNLQCTHLQGHPTLSPAPKNR